MSTTYARTINGNPIYAAISDADSAGNTISTTYATKSELPDGVPAVTSSDNNKVLKASYSEGVASYSWQPESGGGSSDVFLVTYGTTTFAEIQAANNAGKAVFLHQTQAANNSGYLIPMSLIFDGGGSGSLNRAEFEEPMSSSTGGYVATCRVYSVAKSNNAWSSYYKYAVAQPLSTDTGKVLQCNGADKARWASISQVPASTSSDENKVLTVNSSGTPEWATPSGGGSVTDVEVNGSSVVNASGVAEVTVPAQVQTDWDATSGLGEILNKPVVMGLVAGNNVTITEGASSITIAATDTTYTAGTGLNLSNGEFSVDSTVVALQTDIPTVPTAGNMLSVTSNTLNVTTTAGITDIQQVASLPANPVATVLYLIPET